MMRALLVAATAALHDAANVPRSPPTAAAMLHRKTGAPVLIGYHHRTESGQELNLKRVETPIDVENPNFDRDFTAQLTHDLEEAIKCHPEQWVWLHQRWKTQPSPPRQDPKTR